MRKPSDIIRRPVGELAYVLAHGIDMFLRRARARCDTDALDAVEPGSLDFDAILDMMRRCATCLAYLVETARVSRVPATNDDHELNLRGNLGGAILAFLCCEADGLLDTKLLDTPFKRAEHRGDTIGALRRLDNDADPCGQLVREFLGDVGNGDDSLSAPSAYALNLGVTRFADDDDGVTLLGKLSSPCVGPSRHRDRSHPRRQAHDRARHRQSAERCRDS